MPITVGNLVWVTNCPPKNGGVPKTRPGVVICLSPNDDTFLVVMCTTSQQEFDEEVGVDVPWNSQGNCKSGLKEPTRALPHWRERITESDIEDDTLSLIHI